MLLPAYAIVAPLTLARTQRQPSIIVGRMNAELRFSRSQPSGGQIRCAAAPAIPDATQTAASAATIGDRAVESQRRANSAATATATNHGRNARATRPASDSQSRM